MVVVGAGFIGMELASSLRERGLEVDLVTPDPLPLSRVFDDRIASLLKSRHEARGVRFHLGRTPTRVLSTEGRASVTLSDGTTLAADLVVFGVGVTPSLEYLAGTGLAQAGGVQVDARLATAHPDIFAAGDIALVPPAHGGDPERIEHWAAAQRQGRHAAFAMLGADAPFRECPFFWTKQAGVSLKAAGNLRGFDQVVYRGEVESGRFLAGYYQKGRLCAAVTAGRVVEHIAVERALAAGRTLPPARFADPGFDIRTGWEEGIPPTARS
jgi:NADPH-dependent 2,4-dienoyl-CoA reductase/sulfur reductase-like enzyme